MIVELLFNLIAGVIKILFIFINLPGLPQEAQNSFDQYFDLIFDNLGFIGFFVRPSTLSVVALTSITLWSFSKLYKVTMWIYHKLPISSN